MAKEPPSLRHITSNDRSSPALEPGTSFQPFDKKALLQEIAGGVALKHPDAVHDASSPRIEEGIHIQPSQRPALLCEIQAVGAHSAAVHELKATPPRLAHVSTVDKASPVIPPDATVRTWDKEGLLADIRASSPVKLQHVAHGEANDRSAPRIPPNAHVETGGSVVKELVAELQQQGSGGLRHVGAEDIVDKSAPKVTLTAAMRIHSHPIGE